MSTTTVNVDLLRDVLTHIEQHPETWDQNDFARKTACGTRYCVAGHAVVMSGFTPIWEATRAWEVERDGERQEIANLASDLLGIPRWDGDDDDEHLFYDENTLDDLWRIAAEISDGAITRPAAHAATSPSK